MNFRIKTILGIALIQSLLLIILSISIMSFLNSSNEQQLQQRAQTTSTLFAKSVKNAILSTDLATLESFTEEILTIPDILYVRITNKHFLLAQAGDPKILNKPFVLDTQLSQVDDGSFDTQVKVTEGDTVYGVIEMGWSTASIETSFARAQNWIISIATFEVLLVAVLSFLFGTYLTKQLQRLKVASESISTSGPGLQIAVTGHDEIAEVASAFNLMSATLQENYNKLSRSVAQEKKMTVLANSNKAKNEAILNASLDALITINEKGEVLDYNKIAVLTFGWRYEEIIGKDLADFIIPSAMRHAHHSGMEKYLKTKQGPVLNKRIQLTAQHKDGHTFPIEINIAPIESADGLLFTAFIHDISARLQAESELRIAAQTFESNEAILICDAQAKILRINHAFIEITGYTHDEVIGKDPSILSSGQHSHAYYQQMWQSLSEQGTWSGEIYNKRKNGEIYPEYINISLVKDTEGKISHYIAHFVDISEQKENEENLRKAQREAELSNEAKSRFVASMSHEIRTPMSAVLGILGLLKDSQLTEQQLQLVQTGQESGELLLTIINDILDFTKMDIDKLQLENSRFDLHQLLRSCNELLENIAHKKSIALLLTQAADLPQFVSGDATRLRQILINLINNAIKFTSKGQVHVIARVDSIIDEQIILHCQVKDTGIGIEKAYQETLFDEFTMVDQTHSRKYEGTGLGLAICKRLVTLMHGDIKVSSLFGQGSTFEFTVHLQLAEAAHSAIASTQQQKLPQANTRVLLAEDNTANQMVIKSILEFSGLQVDVVGNGYQALEAVRNHPYDIVLMDISMPEMDGMTATKEIRKLSGVAANIPIIALTAHTLNGDKDRFIEVGMNDYLSKPIDRAATLNCIAQWTKTPSTQPATLTRPAQQTINNDSTYKNKPYLDEQVLAQLVRDTSADIVPELITLYIEDSQARMAVITEAIKKRDFATLEFEAHTIGSSAIAHGNSKFHAVARNVEHLCQQNDHDQAIAQAHALAETAVESLRLLALRVTQGF